jgi:hypothetical protein
VPAAIVTKMVGKASAKRIGGYRRERGLAAAERWEGRKELPNWEPRSLQCTSAFSANATSAPNSSRPPCARPGGTRCCKSARRSASPRAASSCAASWSRAVRPSGPTTSSTTSRTSRAPGEVKQVAGPHNPNERRRRLPRGQEDQWRADRRVRPSDAIAPEGSFPGKDDDVSQRTHSAKIDSRFFLKNSTKTVICSGSG